MSDEPTNFSLRQSFSRMGRRSRLAETLLEPRLAQGRLHAACPSRLHAARNRDDLGDISLAEVQRYTKAVEQQRLPAIRGQKGSKSEHWLANLPNGSPKLV